MAYCTATDVQADFKAIVFNSTSMVTSTAITDFITEADALINSYVGARWTTPITANSDSVALMKLCSRTIVADRIRGILANKQQTATDANQQVSSDGFSVKNVMALLNDIKLGNVQLTGADLLLPNAGMFSNNYERNELPRFRKNRKSW